MDNQDLDKNSSSEAERNSHGGKREGAGRPAGATSEETKAQREALAKFKERVRKRLDRLFNAQASLAEGLQYLYKGEMDDKGKMEYTQITDPDEIKAALDAGLDKMEDGKIFFITAKDPDTKALDSLLDRTFGKAKEVIELDNKKPLAKVQLELVLPDGRRENLNSENNTGLPEDSGSAQVGENNT